MFFDVETVSWKNLVVHTRGRRQNKTTIEKMFVNIGVHNLFYEIAPVICVILYGEMGFYSDYSFQITNIADHSINYKNKLNFLNICCEVSSESKYLSEILMNLLYFPYNHAPFVSHFQVAPQLIMRLLSETMIVSIYCSSI